MVPNDSTQTSVPATRPLRRRIPNHRCAANEFGHLVTVRLKRWALLRGEHASPFVSTCMLKRSSGGGFAAYETDDPEFLASHSSSASPEIASMKSMSSLCRSASASASASRCASAAKAADRTSGSHTSTGRYPRSRIRRRYSADEAIPLTVA